MATSKTNTSNKKTVNTKVSELKRVAAVAKSKGIDTRKADAMVSQHERQGYKPFAGSKEEKQLNKDFAITPEKIINSSTLKPTGTVKYPEYKDTPVPDYTMNNTGLTGGEFGITTDGTNLNVEQPKDEYSALTKIYEDYNKSLTDAQDDMTTGADVRKKLERETQIKQLRQEEADYASQINTITANRDAAVLSLEGQGRGQTEGFIGGEQARINREAAIKALPIQAQLAAAQNKVQLAQDHINTWGAILMQDAQNKYNFKKEQFTALKDYLTDVEKLRLAKLEKENDRKYAEKQSNIKQLTEIMADAAANGQSGLISQIKTLNPETVTAQQLLNLAGQLRKPVSPTDSTPKVVSVNGVDSVWNPTTKQFEAITVGGVDGGNLKPVKDAEIKDLSETWTAKNSVLSLVDSLQNNIRENGTQNLFGTTAGERTGDTTNLLLAMKNLEKTGALDAGTIKVLEGTIPSSKFFATEAAQIASLQSIKDTIESKVNEYVGSYRGTTAETDPRTKRIYGEKKTFDSTLFVPDEVNEVYQMFGVANSTASRVFNADDWLNP